MVSSCFVRWRGGRGRRDFCKDLPEMEGLEVATRDCVSVLLSDLKLCIVACVDDRRVNSRLCVVIFQKCQDEIKYWVFSA